MNAAMCGRNAVNVGRYSPCGRIKMLCLVLPTRALPSCAVVTMPLVTVLTLVSSACLKSANQPMISGACKRKIKRKSQKLVGYISLFRFCDQGKSQLLHPATPYYPFPRVKNHTRGNIWSFTVG